MTLDTLQDVVLPFAAGAIILVLVACAPETFDDDLCGSGDSLVCSCDDGSQGERYCRTDGSGYESLCVNANSVVCGSDDSQPPGDDDDDPPADTGTVKPGDPCSTDDECAGTARCMNSLVQGAAKYCALQCDVSSDCFVMDQSDTWYYIALPDNLKTYSRWKSDHLWRVFGCMDPAERPSMGTPDGNNYCGYACPLNSAAIHETYGSSTVTACACLPNYRDADSGPVQDCQWDETTECSLFRGCTVENTEVAECSQGEFTCIVNEGLEGLCLDLVTGEDIEQCVWESCDTGECDGACLAGCGTTPECVESCCSCT